MADEKVDRLLEQVDAEKREFLRKVVVGAAYTAPIVASFAMESLAEAAVGGSPNTA